MNKENIAIGGLYALQILFIILLLTKVDNISISQPPMSIYSFHDQVGWEIVNFTLADRQYEFLVNTEIPFITPSSIQGVHQEAVCLQRDKNCLNEDCTHFAWECVNSIMGYVPDNCEYSHIINGVRCK